MADTPWRPGKPIKFIPIGDVAAAAEWIPLARKLAWDLVRQGNYHRRIITPAPGVTISIETLAGIPRVFIETGFDYIASHYNSVSPLDPVTSSHIWGGMLTSGAATSKGTTEFGQYAGHNLHPLGGGEFLGGPPPHEFSGAAAFISVKGATATGQAFSPWQDPSYVITGIQDVLYSGLVDIGEVDADMNPVYKKRLHILYEYERTMPHSGAGPYTITQPAIATSLDGGATFTVTPFVINIQATIGFPGDFDAENFQNVNIRSAIFCGDNKIALIGRAYGPDIRWNDGSSFVATLSGSICSLTSDDGGATWAFHLVPQTWGILPSPMTCTYIGTETPDVTTYTKILGVSSNPGSGIGLRETYLSTDAGATFLLVETSASAPNINLASLTCLALDSAMYYRQEKVYRTHDAGITWEELPATVPVAASTEAIIMNRGAPAIRSVATPPDPLPEGAYLADYTQLAAFGNRTGSPNVRVLLSNDGGKTWSMGGSIAVSALNLGLVNTRLLPFPVFPDLHKNGMPIP